MVRRVDLNILNGSPPDNKSAMKIPLTINLLFLVLFSACKKEVTQEYIPFTYTDSITDVEGNIYHTVTIGSKVWMAENLRTTHYNNGDTITNERTHTDWSTPLGGAYCFYNNDSAALAIYGCMYNFDAVTDPRGIAPPGWHVPTYYEWLGLVSYLGQNAGNKLREHGNKHWIVANDEATDEFGFAALPGGYRDFQGDFYDVRTSVQFWSATHYLPSSPTYPEAWYLDLVGDKDPTLGEPEHALSNVTYIQGCYIRCVKD